MAHKKRRRPSTPSQKGKSKPFKPSCRPRATEAEVTLVRGKGSRTTAAKWYWHIFQNETRVGRAYVSEVMGDDGSERPFVTVELSRRHQGQGIGTIAFRRACLLSGYSRVWASLRKSNIASRIALERAGFESDVQFRGIGLQMVWHENRSNDSSPNPAHHNLHISVSKAHAASCHKAMEMLFPFFPDHCPHLVRDEETSWKFRIQWASDSRHFVDRGVRGAAKEIYDADLDRVGPFRRMEEVAGREVVISMLHSWAILAPFGAASRIRQLPECVVHMDAHEDLMPFVGRVNTEGGIAMASQLNERPLPLDNDDAIVSAIEKGLIHKGNFLSVYLAACNGGTRVIHVRPGAATSYADLRPCPITMEPGGSTVDGTGIEKDIIKATDDNWNYTCTPTIPSELPVQGNARVWLDIDMDAFCNRYDGDSDRAGRLGSKREYDETVHHVASALESLTTAEWI